MTKKNLTSEKLSDLALKFGTPLFITQKQKILDNIKNFRKGFAYYKGGFTLCYSAKTNSQLAILNIMKNEGVVAEVCSLLDLSGALRVGFEGPKIIYEGLVKTNEELELAVKNRVKIINIESMCEAVRLSDIAEKNNLKLNVGIRLAFPSKTGIKSLLGVTYDRFGASVKTGEAKTIAEFIIKSKKLNLIGLHCHTGSNQKSKDNYLVGVDVIIDFMKYLYNDYNLKIELINLGGGIGLEHVKFYTVFDLALNSLRRMFGYPLIGGNDSFEYFKIAENITEYLHHKLDENSLVYPHLMMEPGRSLVGDAVDLLLSVVNVKDTDLGSWIVVDGGTNLLPVLTLFSEFHNISVISDSKSFKKASVSGPLLYSADILSGNRLLPEASIGDLILIHDVGAYCNSQANQFLYPRAATILIDGNSEYVIQRRESIDDVLRRDVIL
jgi:diaminopimelate decarboxylase